jgi:3-hydroxybutyryl-CoA dehydrogenase
MTNKEINILGFGTMGKQIAILFGLLGYKVNIFHRSFKSIDTPLDKKFLLEKKIIEKNLNKILTINFNFFDKPQDLECHLTFECLREDRKVKNDIISNLNYKKNIFSNTSSLVNSDFDFQINFFHFMNPIFTKFIEISLNYDSYDKFLLNAVKKDLQKFGYDFLPVSPTPGFIINKMIFMQLSNIFIQLEVFNIKYSDLVKINNVLNIYDLSILKTMDIIGLDICEDIFKKLSNEYKFIRTPKTLRKAISNNILGRKNKTSVLNLEIFSS